MQTKSQFRNINTDFILNNCLFGSVKLNKNANLDKYKYSCYGIGFDFRLEFLFTDGNFGKNVFIFELIWAHLWILIIKIKIS